MTEPSNEALAIVTTPAGSFYVCETPEEVAHAQGSILMAHGPSPGAIAALVTLTLAEPHPSPGQNLYLSTGMIGVVVPVNDTDLAISRKAFADQVEAARKATRGDEGEEKQGAGFR